MPPLSLLTPPSPQTPIPTAFKLIDRFCPVLLLLSRWPDTPTPAGKPDWPYVPTGVPDVAALMPATPAPDGSLVLAQTPYEPPLVADSMPTNAVLPGPEV